MFCVFGELTSNGKVSSAIFHDVQVSRVVTT